MYTKNPEFHWRPYVFTYDVRIFRGKNPPQEIEKTTEYATGILSALEFLFYVRNLEYPPPPFEGKSLVAGDVVGLKRPWWPWWKFYLCQPQGWKKVPGPGGSRGASRLRWGTRARGLR